MADEATVVNENPFQGASDTEVRKAIGSLHTEVGTIFDRYRDPSSGEVAYEKMTDEDGIRLGELNLRLAQATDQLEKVSDRQVMGDAHERLAHLLAQPVDTPEQPKRGPRMDFGMAVATSDAVKNYNAGHVKEAESKIDFKDVKMSRELKAVLGEDDTLTDVDSEYTPDEPRLNIMTDVLHQPNNIAPLFPNIPISSPSFEYMVETITAEGAAETAEGALIPEADISYAPATASVRKIPVALPVTDELLEDETLVRGMVNARLPLFVNKRLDSQLLLGDGTGQNLTGVLNTGGISNVNWSVGTDTTAQSYLEKIHDAIVTAKGAFLNPDFVVVNAKTAGFMRLAKDSQNNYLLAPVANAGFPLTIWGLPVIENENMVDYDTATNIGGLVGAFQQGGAVVRRRGVTVAVSDSHDDRFLRDILTIKVSLRAGIVVFRPAAFTKITTVA